GRAGDGRAGEGRARRPDRADRRYASRAPARARRAPRDRGRRARRSPRRVVDIGAPRHARGARDRDLGVRWARSAHESTDRDSCRDPAPRSGWPAPAARSTARFHDRRRHVRARGGHGPPRVPPPRARRRLPMTDVSPKAVVLLSGGLDSTTALAVARSKGFACYALTVRYGQLHEVE